METVEVKETQILSSLLEGPLVRQRTSSAEGRDWLRAEKIKRIRELVLRGEYHVPAEDVAKAVMRRGIMRILRQKKL
jgi:anti-sigma28 factor (negative regulator of flagellin synthesis)